METIYLLCDPRTNEPRYVGVTSRTLAKRLRQHRNQALSGVQAPVMDWHRKLIKLGLRPVVEVLEVTEDRAREAWWIAHYRLLYPRILNLSDGGNHAPSSSPEVAAKISAALRGRKLSAAHKLAMAAGRPKNFRHTDETRQKMRKPKTPEHRQNARLALNAKRANGECRVLRGDDNPMRRHPELVLRGAKNALAKLTDEQVMEMRRLFAAGASTTELARVFGVSQPSAHRIVVGQAWTHLPGACPPRGKGKKPWLKLAA